MLQKILFLGLAALGVVMIFYMSWFWRALLIPMVILLLFDVTKSFWDKR